MFHGAQRNEGIANDTDESTTKLSTTDEVNTGS